MVPSTEAPQPSLRLIKLNNTPLSVCWKRERIMLKPLAPSRRDLALRLLRNALPLGVKRVHWNLNCQTSCMLCTTGALESAEHLLWECGFAKDTWSDLALPWSNHRGAPITWSEVLRGFEVRLNNAHNTVIEQLWSIIRTCIIRVIWLERNRRYFYANLPNRTPTYRRNQGLDDIRAHTESWLRRANDQEKVRLNDALHCLADRSTYQAILSPVQNTPAMMGLVPTLID